MRFLLTKYQQEAPTASALTDGKAEKETNGIDDPNPTRA
jgi:hypothetical protein